MNKFLCNLIFAAPHSNSDDIELYDPIPPHDTAVHCTFGVVAHFPFSMANILLKFTFCTTISNLWTPLNPHTPIIVCIIFISYVLIPSNGFPLLYMHFPCVDLFNIQIETALGRANPRHCG
jgi:hypothetical protein